MTLTPLLPDTPFPRRLVRGLAQRWMPALAALAAVMLAACATPTKPITTTGLLHDEFFDAQAQRVEPGDVFALSDEMRAYADHDLAERMARGDPRLRLIDALYRERQLRLAYDNGRTRNAAQAFAERSGNCLSLVIMTAAFARHMGLPVAFRSVEVGEFYSRQGDLFLASGHVNLVLDKPYSRAMRSTIEDAALTVDFIEQRELIGQRVTPVDEQTIVAMYLNNRAAEALGSGLLDEAYGWARLALLRDPGFLAAANTLGVIYNRSGHGAAAETVLRHVLAHEPDNTSALSNLVGLLSQAGRSAESQALSERLVQLQPLPPFHHFGLGRQAMAEGNPKLALEMFKRELRRQPYQEDVLFWAAQAYWQLGEPEAAAGHLRQAMDSSGSQAGRDRYAAKLAHLRDGSPR